MQAKAAASPSDWKVGVRIWVERAGHAVLGQGRLELLEGIDRHKSISAAARKMGMSYRRAWLLVQSINTAAGFPLVESAVGGSHGGGARLTERGRAALAVFRAVREHVERAAATALTLPAAEADTIHVAAAVSLEEVLNQLLVDYAAEQPQERVRVVFGASDELANLFLLGRGPMDLFLSASKEPLERLEEAGLLKSGAPTALAENGLAVIAASSWRGRALRKPADLCADSFRRVALARPSNPLGRYSEAYLQATGLHEKLHARILYVDNPRGVVGALHAGRADAGFVYSSDALTAGDCPVIWRVRRPPLPIRYWASLMGGESPEARRFLTFLTSSQAAARFRRCGFNAVTASQ